MATARVFAALRRLARAERDGARGDATHRVVTPPVPRWRVGDDAVTALRWLRKYLRHDGAGDARGRGARGGSAVHQLFRARVVRVGRGALGEGVERDARSLRRAGRARTLAPGEFLAVPIAREGWTWREYGDEDANGDGDATRRARDRDGASEALVEAIRARVLHADEHVTVVDKPPGLATTRGNGVDVSVYDLRHALDSEYVVHRLDRDTSGVLVLARTAFAANRLNAMFAKKSRMDFTEIMRADMERGDDAFGYAVERSGGEDVLGADVESAAERRALGMDRGAADGGGRRRRLRHGASRRRLASVRRERRRRRRRRGRIHEGQSPTTPRRPRVHPRPRRR